MTKTPTPTTPANSETPWVLIIGGIVLSAWLFNRSPSPQPNPQPRPDIAPIVPAVSKSLLALKQVAKAGDKTAVANLSKLYSDFAEVLSRVEPGTLQSSQLRTWLMRADTYLIRGTNMVGAVPGFGAAKDAVITEALGLDDRQLEAKDIATAVATLRAIADALK